MAAFQLRHFTFRHPLFKARKSASGVWYEDSIYYLWWEFLRRHEGYKKTCENGGKGQYTKLYADFGDVHATGFKQWWSKDERGARLFAEPAMPQSIQTISPEEVGALSEAWKSGAVMVIAIPLSLPKRFISQKTAQLLRQHNPRKRGQRMHKESKARYPIAAQHDIRSLQTTLAVYDMRISKPQPKLWEITQALKFGVKDDLLTKEELQRKKAWATDAVSHKKISMSVAASKRFGQAKKIIDGVGKGIFPAISARASRT